jgi:hypothetical protein
MNIKVPESLSLYLAKMHAADDKHHLIERTKDYKVKRAHAKEQRAADKESKEFTYGQVHRY